MTRPASALQYHKFDFAHIPEILELHAIPLLPTEPFRQLSYIERYVRELGCKTILLEPHYIDRHYMEDHSILYSKNFLSLPNYCKRLHFFSLDSEQVQREIQTILRRGRTKDRRSFFAACEDFSEASYLGFCVIKPLEGSPVGRTTLRCLDEDAGSGLKRTFASVGKYRVHVAGCRLTVKGLPFQQQDIGVSACATTALWSSLQQSRVFEEIRPATPAQITLLASQYALPFGKAMPNEGLSVDQMCQATQALGVPPNLINVEGKFEDARAHLHSATLSGFAPVLVIQCDGNPDENHAVTVTGVKLDSSFDPKHSPRPDVDMASGLLGLYIHDDRIGPYVMAETSNSRGSLLLAISVDPPKSAEPWRLTHILIPMHAKIRISFPGLREVAIRIVARVAKDLKNLLINDSSNIKLLDFPKICFSTKIERSTRYVQDRIFESEGMGESDLQNLISNTALSRYVGRILIESDKIGKIDVLVDTTSTKNNINFLAVIVRRAGRFSNEIANSLSQSCRCDVRS